MTSSNTLDRDTFTLGETHCEHQPSRWPGVVLFVILWLGITIFLWLVNVNGINFSDGDFRYPIQKAMVSFVHAVIKYIFDLTRMLPWPNV